MTAKIRDQGLIDFAMQLYIETKSGPKTAKKIGVSEPTLYKWLRDRGIAVPGSHSAVVNNRKKKLQGSVAAEAARDYAAGMPMTQLRTKYGVSMWAIHTAAKDSGVERRSRGARGRQFSDEDRAEIAKLYRAEWSQAAIAAKFSAHQITISRLLRRSGVSTRKRAATAADHGSWQGGTPIAPQGYRYEMVMTDDPFYSMRNSSGYVLQHRLVMSRHLGRALSRDETVHHVNGNRQDNRLENLQLRTQQHGAGSVAVCSACGSRSITYERLLD